MARPRALRIREGATCSVLVKRLRPSRNVAEAILNASANQRVEDLVATHHAITTRNSRSFQTIFFTSPSIPGLEISAARRYVVVTAEGDPDAIWEHFTAGVLSWECWQHVGDMSAICQNVNEFGNFCMRVPTPKFPRHKIFVSKVSDTVPHTRTYIRAKIQCPPQNSDTGN